MPAASRSRRKSSPKSNGQYRRAAGASILSGSPERTRRFKISKALTEISFAFEHGRLLRDLSNNYLTPELFREWLAGVPLRAHPRILPMVPFQRHAHGDGRVVGSAEHHQCTAFCQCHDEAGGPG